MAFISEIHFRSGDAGDEAEFIEIALGPGEDPSDFTISFYDRDGDLETGISGVDPLTGTSVIVNGEVNLASLDSVPDPENPGFMIYRISGTVTNPLSGEANALFDGTTGNSSDEAHYVTLFNTNSGTLVDGYGVNGNPTTTVNGGVADGETAVTTTVSTASGESIQFDIFGNETAAPRTSGNAVICFGHGTQILTIDGEKPVQDLRTGDLIVTCDHGPQPLRWMSISQKSSEEIRDNPKLGPVRITAGALGPQAPHRDLMVSYQHRMMLRSKIIERQFGTPEVLAPAGKLICAPGVELVRPEGGFTYYHLMFDRHEVIFAEGAPTESLLLGDEALKTLRPYQIADLRSVLRSSAFAHQTMEPAREIEQKSTRVAALVARHLRNGRPLVSHTDQGHVSETSAKAAS